MERTHLGRSISQIIRMEIAYSFKGNKTIFSQYVLRLYETENGELISTRIKLGFSNVECRGSGVAN